MLVHHVFLATLRCIESDIVVGDQHQVLNQDTAGFANGIFRVDGAVGFHFDSEFFVVGALADTGIFYFVRHIFDGRIDGVDRDDANSSVFRHHVIGRLIAAAFGNGEFQFEVDGGFHAAKQEVRVHHLEHVGEFFNISGAKFFPAADGQVDFFLLEFFVLDKLFDPNLFEVEHDIHHVFHYTTDGSELVVDTADAHSADGKAFKRGKEYATERVANRLAEARFEGFEFKSAFKIRCFLEQDFVGLLEIENTHGMDCSEIE